MKLIGKILLILLLIIVVLVVGRNFIIKSVAQIACPLVTGFKLEMKQFSLGLFSTDLRIKGLKVYNPEGFEEPLMVDLPELTVDYNLKDIIGGKMYFKKIVLDLEQVNLVKNSEGVSSLDRFTQKKEGEEEQPKEEPKKEEPKEAKPLDLKIDHLVLKVGVISFIDYSKSVDNPSISHVKLKIDEDLTDVTNPQTIALLIIPKIMANVALGKITGFNLDGLGGMMSGAVGGAQDLAANSFNSAKDVTGKMMEKVDVDAAAESVQEVGVVVGEAAGAVVGEAGAVVGEAGDAIKDGAKALTGFGKKLFGKK